MRTPWAAAAAVLMGLALATPAAAGIQDFTVRNNGAVDVFYIYVSPDTTDDWEDDVLGDDTLAAGAQVDITMSGYGDHCVFDIKIEDANGGSREYYAVDLCTVTYVDYP
jgi:hypothetical protein